MVHEVTLANITHENLLPSLLVERASRAVDDQTLLVPAKVTFYGALADTKVAVPRQNHEYLEGLLVRVQRECFFGSSNATTNSSWRLLSRPFRMFTLELDNEARLHKTLEAMSIDPSELLDGTAAHRVPPCACYKVKAEVEAAGTLCAVLVWFELDLDGERAVLLTTKPAALSKHQHRKAPSSPGGTATERESSSNSSSTKAEKEEEEDEYTNEFRFGAAGQTMHWLPTQYEVKKGDVVRVEASLDLRALFVIAFLEPRPGLALDVASHPLPLSSIDPTPVFSSSILGERDRLIAELVERLQNTRTGFVAAMDAWRMLGVLTEYAEELGLSPQLMTGLVVDVCRALYA